MRITNYYSPNYNKKKRPISAIKIIVIHYTGMQSERESLKRLSNSGSEVSSHYLITRKGKIYRMVNERNVAWHAGKSCWQKYVNLNEKSIGIELVNKGHHFGYQSFKKKQISSLVILCRKLVKKYKIEQKNIVGHSDIALLRKIDPGKKFPWQYLAKNKIGIWHDYKQSLLRKYRTMRILEKQDKMKFFRNLNKIGYCTSDTNTNKKFLNKTIKAFQRHFRKEKIDGLLDQECSLIAKNLTKRL